ncbi:Oligopeptide ABC transporter, periplasmic oligopeptide-binding protein OppA [Methanosarcina siciliae HI350]|uniref:Oligopeptide ABC transporter, periplasmic oligopeptide-binding protein OppA n=1 Tax=Methanosarcina siciliae HI350 TaxID=1434119 RepID=A0A0E3PFC7_9EURY|nr:ABC transporter substrate-binding protein [Methanosarcina siciliae]AKB33320.1 Oligopeptide ABC transporter, periplasmic oligopeptide-binding protein OppA [Methanosarcina siciliae HI350]
MKKKEGLLFILLALVVMGTGCAEQEQQEELQTLSISGQWSPNTIDPHQSGYIAQRLGYAETLVGVDYEGKITPNLAKSWEVSDDGKNWTFVLREDVLFHDGTPFTAGVMKTSLERSFVRSESIFEKIPISAIEAPDNRTLVIRLESPFPALPAYLSKAESVALAPGSYDEDGNMLKPIGTGPFIFESWKPEEEVAVVKNPDYWGQTASVDKVIYRIMPEALTRKMLLDSKEIQIAMILSPEIAEEYTEKDGYTVLQQPIARVRMLGFNTEKEPFDDQRVRQAVNYAIDREAIVTYVLHGYGTTAAGLFPPGFYWANEEIAPYTYDTEKAKSLLEEAGWTDTNGDGTLDKNGNPLKITLVTYPERAELPSIAEVLQQQLKNVGIETELQVLNVDAANSLRNQGDFDIFLVGRGLLFVPDPDEIMMTDYHSSGTSTDGWGAYRWYNESVDGLLEEARTTSDMAVRKELYDEAQEIIVEEAPVAYLNYYVNIDVTTSDIEGYRLHPTEYSLHLENVSIV